jgi:hypothetical protein
MSMKTLLRPEPEAIGRAMESYPAPWTASHSISWAEWRDWKLAAVPGAVGEVRRLADLALLPPGIPLRAVCIHDEAGFVVRWADSDRLARAGIPIVHDDLYRGEGDGFASQGYIEWSPEHGTLRVTR